MKLGEPQAMRYQSTVFGQLLKAVPRGWFERAAKRHHSGRAKRTLQPWGHLVAMVMGQLAGAGSLRDLERLFAHHPGALAHLGLDRVPRTTLGDANADRPSALFEEVAAKLAGMAGGRGPAREAIRLIDATQIFAGRRVEAWSGGGIKLHMVFDPADERPTCFAVTSDRINDIVAAKVMPIESCATYVFDKGYYDFAFWARLDAAGCRFVTRLKKNSPTHLVEELDICDENILFDRVVTLSARLSGQRRSPYQDRVRLVAVKIDTGRQITLLTNDLSAPAHEIAELYKTRWQIELFFKWIKQNLVISHFMGSSRNAVTIQIMAALIGYLLLRLACLRHAVSTSLQAVARLMPATVLARRTLPDLLRPPNPSRQKPPDLRQFALVYA
jgi:Transposase DDE domain/Domain of unknown function (DUF4372)